MRRYVDRQSDRLALVQRTDKRLVNLAVFLHGFRGNYLTTWGDLPDQFRYEADKKPTFEEWDYAFLGYDTKQVVTYLDIAHFVWGTWDKAANGDPPFRQKYDKLAFFGHSLGTLGFRQALCATTKQPAGMMSALKSVTFFGSPINGSPLAGVGSLFYKIGDALKPSNPQLRMLKAWTEAVHPNGKWPQIRLVLGTDDGVVGYTSGELIGWLGDHPTIHLTNMDHSQLVKPAGWNTAIMDHIETGLR